MGRIVPFLLLLGGWADDFFCHRKISGQGRYFTKNIRVVFVRALCLIVGSSTVLCKKKEIMSFMDTPLLAIL